MQPVAGVVDDLQPRIGEHGGVPAAGLWRDDAIPVAVDEESGLGDRRHDGFADRRRVGRLCEGSPMRPLVVGSVGSRHPLRANGIELIAAHCRSGGEVGQHRRIASVSSS